jgi:hypothetical protein
LLGPTEDSLEGNFAAIESRSVQISNDNDCETGDERSEGGVTDEAFIVLLSIATNSDTATVLRSKAK